MFYKKILLERYYLEELKKKVNNKNSKISKLQKKLKLKKEKKEKIKENLKKARNIYKENREKKTETEIENEKINNEEKFITIDNYIFRDYYNNIIIDTNKTI